MAAEPIVREGALTEESLVAAISTERAAGRTISKLIVGADLERRAVEIVASPSGSALDHVRSALPAVEVDLRIGSTEWRLE